MTESNMSPTIWTVGHSNRSLAEFLDVLKPAAIEWIADVRRFPGSRRCPQFGSDALKASLAEAGIGYQHFPDLGGRRSQRLPDSPNTAWRVDAFNAYADFMLAPEFEPALDALIALASTRRVAVMCSEAVPWRCHRRLIADALIVRGWDVFDLIGRGRARPHALTPFARVVDGRLIYPGPPPPDPGSTKTSP